MVQQTTPGGVNDGLSDTNRMGNGKPRNDCSRYCGTGNYRCNPGNSPKHEPLPVYRTEGKEGAIMKRSRCACGRVKPRDAQTCLRCHNNRMAELKAEARKYVERGTCPRCGTKLYRNNALSGWWQCGAYPCDTHRMPEHRGLPTCSFQCFTE
jgi:hypothetical protein